MESLRSKWNLSIKYKYKTKHSCPKQPPQVSGSWAKADNRMRSTYSRKLFRALYKNKRSLQPSCMGLLSSHSPAPQMRTTVLPMWRRLKKPAAFLPERQTWFGTQGQKPTALSAKSSKLDRKKMGKAYSFAGLTLHFQLRLWWNS